MEYLSGIYCFENIINGKRYVGQAQDIEKRILQHKYRLQENRDNCLALQNAYNKYGKNNFDITILEFCPIDLLDEKEKYWIIKLESHESAWGYNISWGGNCPMRGRSLSEETRKKMSTSQRNVTNRKNGMKGKHHSQETRDKMSKTKKGRPNGLLGKKRSEESTKKMIEKNTGKKRSEEFSSLMSEINLFKKKNKNSTSKYIGVYFEQKVCKWRSYIRYERKRIYLGYFSTEIEAAKAYNAKATELYGDKAKLNIFDE